jgi:hypothetical protein
MLIIILAAPLRMGSTPKVTDALEIRNPLLASLSGLATGERTGVASLRILHVRLQPARQEFEQFALIHRDGREDKVHSHPS